MSNQLLHEIKNRQSTRIISDKPIEEEKIRALFEAAKWAPSGGNAQPWHYVYTLKGDPEREAMEGLLNEGNYWARHAYLLITAFAHTKRKKEDTWVDNQYALHDTGAASMLIVLQAAHMGLATRQLSGFHRELANSTLHVPTDYVPTTMIAIGYPGESNAHLTEKHRNQETQPRKRKTAEEFVFRGTWTSNPS